jgi:methylglyoxal synthase
MIKMKTIAIVAHDKLKSEVVTWCENNRNTLKNCKLVGTAGTANLIYDTTSLRISSLNHGPSGGDIQIASHIIEGNIDMLIFFQDVNSIHPHENDIQSLIRACINNNIPFALNSATADILISELADSSHTDEQENNHNATCQQL